MPSDTVERVHGWLHAAGVPARLWWHLRFCGLRPWMYPAQSAVCRSVSSGRGISKSPTPSSCTPPTQAYQLRLFLESFGVRSALLNAELPLNSRSHILQTFNKGLFDFLIATGEQND
jgi:hypothetical protein